MPRSAVKLIIDEKAPTEEAPLNQDARKALVAEYKKRNPVKFEMKKAALEAWVKGD